MHNGYVLRFFVTPFCARALHCFSFKLTIWRFDGKSICAMEPDSKNVPAPPVANKPAGTAAPPVIAAPESYAPEAQAGRLRVAELYAIGGLALWGVWVALMAVAWWLRLWGTPAMLAGTVCLGALYAYGVYARTRAPHLWIEPVTANPEQLRVFNALASVASKAGLPMPRVALELHPHEVRLASCGWNIKRGGIVVPQGLLEQVQPSDEELRALLARELGWLSRPECGLAPVLETPLRAVGFIRHEGAAGWRTFSSAIEPSEPSESGSWITLIVLILCAVIVVYLTVTLAPVLLAIALMVLLLLAFERERTFFMDQLAANLLESASGLQSAIARQEFAAERISRLLRLRRENTPEGQEINPNIPPPTKPQDVDEFISDALVSAALPKPGAWKKRLFSKYPSPELRVYYLHYPSLRQRTLSQLMNDVEAWLARRLPARTPSQPPLEAPLKAAIMLGGCVGLAGAQLVLWRYTAYWWAQLLPLFAGGWVLGQWARKQGWAAGVLLRTILAAAYACSSVWFISGVLLGNRMAWGFPAMFLAAAACFCSLSLVIIRTRPPKLGK